ncbi:hypothetical protein H0H93_006783 [Arthromyces matolae]|nr:hypothetical protein H0H93_006783 [Arthromyces matolae]
MAPLIYTSTISDVPVYSRSIFTHISNSGNFPPDFPAYTDAATSTTLSRAAFKHAALSFANGIRTHPRLTPQARGDTLLLFAPNSIAFPVVLLGCVAAGIRCSPANTAYVPRELQHQYTDSGSTIVITSLEGLPVVLEMFTALKVPQHDIVKRVVVIGPGLAWAGGPSVNTDVPYLTLDDLLALGPLPKEESFDGSEAHQTALVCYSSGTTGKPKGVETTHANITTNVDIACTAFKVHHPHDRLLGVLPFYHIYGIAAIILVPFVTGMPVIVMPRFDPETFCANIEKFKITMTMVVPPVLVVLARHPAVDKYNLSTLKKAFSAAAPLKSDLIQQVTERFKKKGRSIAVMQGTSHPVPPHILTPAPSAAGKILRRELRERAKKEGVKAKL